MSMFNTIKISMHISFEGDVPFRRELYTASSFEGRFGNASSVTGTWSMITNTHCTWHWQADAYDAS